MRERIYGSAITWVNPQATEKREKVQKVYTVSPNNRFYELWRSGGHFSSYKSVEALEKCRSRAEAEACKRDACEFCQACNGMCSEGVRFKKCHLTRTIEEFANIYDAREYEDKHKDDPKSSRIITPRKYEIDDFTLELRSVRKSLIAAARVAGVPGGVAQDTLEGLTLFMEGLKLLKKKNPEAYKKIVEITTKEVK